MSVRSRRLERTLRAGQRRRLRELGKKEKRSRVSHSTSDLITNHVISGIIFLGMAGVARFSWNDPFLAGVQAALMVSWSVFLFAYSLRQKLDFDLVLNPALLLPLEREVLFRRQLERWLGQAALFLIFPWLANCLLVAPFQWSSPLVAMGITVLQAMLALVLAGLLHYFIPGFPSGFIAAILLIGALVASRVVGGWQQILQDYQPAIVTALPPGWILVAYQKGWLWAAVGAAAVLVWFAGGRWIQLLRERFQPPELDFIVSLEDWDAARIEEAQAFDPTDSSLEVRKAGLKLPEVEWPQQGEWEQWLGRYCSSREKLVMEWVSGSFLHLGSGWKTACVLLLVLSAAIYFFGTVPPWVFWVVMFMGATATLETPAGLQPGRYGHMYISLLSGYPVHFREIFRVLLKTAWLRCLFFLPLAALGGFLGSQVHDKPMFFCLIFAAKACWLLWLAQPLMIAARLGGTITLRKGFRFFWSHSLAFAFWILLLVGLAFVWMVWQGGFWLWISGLGLLVVTWIICQTFLLAYRRGALDLVKVLRVHEISEP